MLIANSFLWIKYEKYEKSCFVGKLKSILPKNHLDTLLCCRDIATQPEFHGSDTHLLLKSHKSNDKYNEPNSPATINLKSQIMKYSFSFFKKHNHVLQPKAHNFDSICNSFCSTESDYRTAFCAYIAGVSPR